MFIGKKTWQCTEQKPWKKNISIILRGHGRTEAKAISSFLRLLRQALQNTTQHLKRKKTPEGEVSEWLNECQQFHEYVDFVGYKLEPYLMTWQS